MSGSTQVAAWDFLVRRDDLRTVEARPAEPAAGIGLGRGEVLLRIDRFAFTANNITYAVAKAADYWAFFPVAGDSCGRVWGRVPVWALGQVIASPDRAALVGARVFGYFPMSTHLVARPDRITKFGFVDGAAHRIGLPPVYNHYAFVGGGVGDADLEDREALLRPLFVASFLIDAFLADRGDFDARSILVSSASSKTAAGLAFLLQRRRPAGVEIVGLTSPRNDGFVRMLGCYDRVVAYGDIAAPADDGPAVFVDFAGSSELIAAVHQAFGMRLRHSCLVGATHWRDRSPVGKLPGPVPTFFFAPDHIRARVQAWTRYGFEVRFGASLRDFALASRAWLAIERRAGPEAVNAAYFDVLEGRASPGTGYLLSL